MKSNRPLSPTINLLNNKQRKPLQDQTHQSKINNTINHLFKQQLDKNKNILDENYKEKSKERNKISPINKPIPIKSKINNFQSSKSFQPNEISINQNQKQDLSDIQPQKTQSNESSIICDNQMKKLDNKKLEESKIINKLQKKDIICSESFISVIIRYKQKECSIEIPNTIKTSEQLQKYLINFALTNQIFDHLNPNILLGFQTQKLNYALDYYLWNKDSDITLFLGRVLELIPFFKQNKSNTQYNLNDFYFLKCIGVGGFSKVYLVRRKLDGEFLAMKLIKKDQIVSSNKQHIIQNEKDIMASIKSQFVSKLQHTFESKHFIVFVMDYYPGGEMFFLLKNQKNLTENQAVFYFSQICLGMLYLHKNNIVYRDVKPENILIDAQGYLRIADFGLSKPLISRDEVTFSFCGSPEYMAPEMLLQYGHNQQIDHYCLGVLLYELVVGVPPFYNKDLQQIYQDIIHKEVEFPSNLKLSTQLTDLIKGLLHKDPSLRLGRSGIEEILSNPWFAQISLKDVANKKIKPPIIPNLLQLNFDQKETQIPDNQFQEILVNSILAEANKEEYPILFKNIYYEICTQGSSKETQINQLYQNIQFIIESSKEIEREINEKKMLHNHTRSGDVFPQAYGDINLLGNKMRNDKDQSTKQGKQKGHIRMNTMN